MSKLHNQMEIPSTNSCSNKQAKNILILGETGVGKSTWINAISNYFHFDKLEDACKEDINVHIPTCFYQFNQEIKIGKESKSEIPNYDGWSATQKPMVYTLIKDGEPYINLIDTPGIGDTRGMEKDMDNFNEIMAYICSMKNLDAICILLKPNVSRLTLTFSYCIKELFMRLHRSVKHNILFCFTHSRCSMYGPGDTLPVLNKELANNNIGIEAIHNSKNRNDERNNCFCFDNEAFRYLVLVKNKINFQPEVHQTYAESWSQAKSETLALFKKIDYLVPYNVADTISVNQARKIIIALSKPMGECLSVIIDNIRTAREFQIQVQATDDDLVNIENTSKFTGISLLIEYFEYPVTVCCHKDCVKYVRVGNSQYVFRKFKQICYQHLNSEDVATQIINNPKYADYDTFSDAYICQICYHACDVHMITTYATKIVEEEFIPKEMQTLIKNKKTKREKIEELKIQTQNKIRELQKEKRTILKTAAKFGAYLVKNTLVPYNDYFVDYINLIIKEEVEKSELLRNSNKLQKLKEILHFYKEQKKSSLDAIGNGLSEKNISAEDITGLKDQLTQLKHMGKTLNNALQSVMYCLEKAQTERQQLVIGKIENNAMNVTYGDRNHERKNSISFDNEACSVKNGKNNSIETQETNLKIWDHDRIEYFALLKLIDFLIPFNNSDTTSANQARKIIVSLSKPIEECLSVITDNIKIAKKYAKDKTYATNSNIKKATMFLGISLSTKHFGYPVTVCTHKDCIKSCNLYYKTCHDHCFLEGVPTQFTNNPLLAHCNAFSNDLKCKVCHHGYDVHMHITYTAKKEDEAFLSEDAQNLVIGKSSRLEQIEEIIKQTQSKVEELKKEREIILNAAAMFGAYLVKNALTAYSYVYEEYINMTMVEDNDDKTELFKNPNLILCEQQKQIILNAVSFSCQEEDINADKIASLGNILTHLKHMGKIFNDHLIGFDKCLRKTETQNLQLFADIANEERNSSISFNKETFRYLASAKQRNNYETKDQSNNENLALFKMIDSLYSQMVFDNISINQPRKIINELSKPMDKCQSVITKNIIMAENLINKIHTANVNFENLLKFRSISLKTNCLEFPVIICTHKDCVEKDSVSTFQKVNTNYEKDFKSCCFFEDATFSNGPKCNDCSHTYDFHEHVTYTLEEEKREFISEDAQKLVMRFTTKSEKIEELISQVGKKVEELYDERNTISMAASRFSRFLLKNAIFAYNKVFGEYIIMLIRKEEEKLEKNSKKVRNLKEIQKSFEERKKLILDANGDGLHEVNINAEHIIFLKDQLINLTHMGNTLKNVTANVMKNFKKIKS